MLDCVGTEGTISIFDVWVNTFFSDGVGRSFGEAGLVNALRMPPRAAAVRQHATLFRCYPARMKPAPLWLKHTTSFRSVHALTEISAGP
jgi:hypothetical protein